MNSLLKRSSVGLNACTAISVLVLLPSIGLSQSLTRLTTSKSTVTGGTSVTGVATLTKAAGKGGLTLKLSSSSTDVSVPSTVSVPAGEISVDFTIKSVPVSKDATCTVTAVDPSNHKDSANVLVQAPRLQSISVSPTSIGGGQPIQIKISLSGPVVKGGESIALSSNHTYLSVPAKATVAAGSSTVTVTGSTTGVATNSSALVTAKDSYSSVNSGSITIESPSSTVRPPTAGDSWTYSVEMTFEGETQNLSMNFTDTSDKSIVAGATYVKDTVTWLDNPSGTSTENWFNVSGAYFVEAARSDGLGLTLGQSTDIYFPLKVNKNSSIIGKETFKNGEYFEDNLATVGEGSVTTPAGTFECWNMIGQETDGDQNSAPTTEQIDMWFCPALGMCIR